jgi:SAM-dependent methyltransferase
MHTEDGSHNHGGLLESTFGLPRGLLGRLGGRLMAFEHRKIYPAVLDALEIAPDESILEIGSGSGAATVLAARRTPKGFVAAADPSPEMVSQTKRRLHEAIAAGRAEVVQAGAECLPFADGRFDGAFAVFSFHHWADRGRGLSELLRVLHPGGRLVIAERLGGHGGRGESEQREKAIDCSLTMLSEAGFAEAECIADELGNGEPVLIKARRPA